MTLPLPSLNAIFVSSLLHATNGTPGYALPSNNLFPMSPSHSIVLLCNFFHTALPSLLFVTISPLRYPNILVHCWTHMHSYDCPPPSQRIYRLCLPTASRRSSCSTSNPFHLLRHITLFCRLQKSSNTCLRWNVLQHISNPLVLSSRFT